VSKPDRRGGPQVPGEKSVSLRTLSGGKGTIEKEAEVKKMKMYAFFKQNF
jgi:hypothetical protein